MTGPGDSLWPNYVKEVDEFLNSTNFNGGLALFQQLESKIMAEIHLILKKRDETSSKRRQLLQQTHRILNDKLNLSLFENMAYELESKAEKEQYHGDATERIYVYLASDNDRVKEAFAHYMEGHANISVMRVDTCDHIVHAKDIHYLKTNGNGTGVFSLAMDWYSLTLANIVFSWRRDTGITSSYAQVSRKQ